MASSRAVTRRRAAAMAAYRYLSQQGRYTARPLEPFLRELEDCSARMRSIDPLVVAIGYVFDAEWVPPRHGSQKPLEGI